MTSLASASTVPPTLPMAALISSLSRSVRPQARTARCRPARTPSFWAAVWEAEGARISLSNRRELTQAESQRAAERLLPVPVTFSHSRVRVSASHNTVSQGLT